MSFTLDVFTISFFSGTFSISLYIFISFFSQTFIIYLSLYLILWLSPIYLSPSLSSARFTVTLQTCKPSPSLGLNQPPPPTLFSSVLDATSVPFSLLSPSLFLHVHYRSLFLTFSLFSPCSHAHVLYSFLLWTPPLSRSLSFSISLSSATLTHFTIFCCGRHLPPLLFHSRFLSSATLTVTLQTRILPPSLSRSLSRSQSLSPANHVDFPYSSTI